MKIFKAIFTSNPEEYAGTHKSQDALRDRMVTIDLDYPDYETELEIIYNKARLPTDVCELITKIVRNLRDSGECRYSPTIRSGIMIAKTLTVMDMEPSDDIDLFADYCQDILSSETGKLAGENNLNTIRNLILDIIRSETKRSHFMAS